MTRQSHNERGEAVPRRSLYLFHFGRSSEKHGYFIFIVLGGLFSSVIHKILGRHLRFAKD